MRAFFGKTLWASVGLVRTTLRASVVLESCATMRSSLPPRTVKTARALPPITGVVPKTLVEPSLATLTRSRRVLGAMPADVMSSLSKMISALSPAR